MDKKLAATMVHWMAVRMEYQLVAMKVATMVEGMVGRKAEKMVVKLAE